MYLNYLWISSSRTFAIHFRTVRMSKNHKSEFVNLCFWGDFCFVLFCFALGLGIFVTSDISVEMGRVTRVWADG